LALLFGFVSIGSFWLMQRIPFNPFRLLLDRSQLAYTLLYYLILAAPFFCSGLAISLLLTRGDREVNRLYAADLLGAGLGCAAICIVMPVFGGSGTVVVTAMFGVLAALVFNSFRPSKLTWFGGVAAVGMLVLAFVAERALPVSVAPEKHHPLQPAGQLPLYSKWNSFSRIDVYNEPAAPKEGRPGPGFSIIIDAGAAGTAIPDLTSGTRYYLAHTAEYQPAGLAYIGREHPKVLIIGSGAGREVLEALYFGASSITAVEINPIINDIVTKRMGEHWGGLFEQPEVRLATEDGRSFVRRSKEKYDAIIAVNTMSDAALTSGALGLSDSYVMTREAFEDYWNHLTPNGRLVVTGYQIPKLLATTREVFDRLGLGSPADHVFAFRGKVAPYGHTQFVRGLVLQKSPLQPEEVDIMADRLGIGRHEQGDDTGQPAIYYSPFESPRSRYQTLLADLLRSPDLEGIYASTTASIQPATDDQPFFNQNVRWSSLRPGVFRSVLGAGQKGDPDAEPVAAVTLVVLLIQAIVVAGVMILLPLVRFHRQGLRVSGRWAYLTYFAGLGLGFILIEIVLLQRLSLFLGQPIYTFSVVLASLLISTGVGSHLANRIENVSHDTLSWFLLSVVGAILLTLFLTPAVLSLTLGFALPLRVASAVLLVVPLGVLLGVPFATGLRVLGKEASCLVPWAWAVNGFFTVIGSVGAMILGMALGFTVVLIIAAACYGVAFIAIRTNPAPGIALGLVRAGDPAAVRESR
jgi:spermidine synthase